MYLSVSEIPGAAVSRMGPCILVVHGDIKAIELVLTGELGYGIYVYTPIEVRFKGINTSHSLPSISGIMYRLLVSLLSVLVYLLLMLWMMLWI